MTREVDQKSIVLFPLFSLSELNFFFFFFILLSKLSDILSLSFHENSTYYLNDKSIFGQYFRVKLVGQRLVARWSSFDSLEFVSIRFYHSGFRYVPAPGRNLSRGEARAATIPPGWPASPLSPPVDLEAVSRKLRRVSPAARRAVSPAFIKLTRGALRRS